MSKALPVARTSADLVAERIAELKHLFPDAVSEGKIDWDKLRTALGEAVETSEERFSFNWAGKRDAVTALQARQVEFTDASEGGPDPIARMSLLIDPKKIYRVTDAEKEQSFHICLDEQIALDTLKPLNLAKDDLFVCRDAALDDTATANLALQCRLRTI